MTKILRIDALYKSYSALTSILLGFTCSAYSLVFKKDVYTHP